MSTLIISFHTLAIFLWIWGLFVRAELQGLFWALPSGVGVGYAATELLISAGVLK